MKTLLLILLEIVAFVLGCIFAPLILVFAVFLSIYLSAELIVQYFRAVHGAFNDTLQDVQGDIEDDENI